MQPRIRIRDVVRGGTTDLGPDQRALRVAYDMFHPKGAVRVRATDVEWVEGQEVRRARFSETLLGDCNPGERVLLSLGPEKPDGDWWLYDVEAIEVPPS